MIVRLLTREQHVAAVFIDMQIRAAVKLPHHLGNPVHQIPGSSGAGSRSP
jgi:hypothetical protein